MSRSNKFL
jgi:small nuclear ribonucleoprotein B and B'